jgi:hypothetical protein
MGTVEHEGSFYIVVSSAAPESEVVSAQVAEKTGILLPPVAKS